jgi:hypothetical protein
VLESVLALWFSKMGVEKGRWRWRRRRRRMRE